MITGLAGNGIPNVALNAYRVAADRMAHADARSCGIDWALLAGIGREESDHGRFAGARLQPGRHVHARASSARRSTGAHRSTSRRLPTASPSTATPSTPTRSARCSSSRRPGRATASTPNGDGKADIFNINDAALGAARYLCANGGNLRTPAGQVRAVLAYNHSDQYVAQVLALADAYRLGVPVSGIPVGKLYGALPPVTATGPYARQPGRADRGQRDHASRAEVRTKSAPRRSREARHGRGRGRGPARRVRHRRDEVGSQSRNRAGAAAARRRTRRGRRRVGSGGTSDADPGAERRAAGADLPTTVRRRRRRPVRPLHRIHIDLRRWLGWDVRRAVAAPMDEIPGRPPVGQGSPMCGLRRGRRSRPACAGRSRCRR